MRRVSGAPLRVFTCLIVLLVIDLPLHGQSTPASLSADLTDVLDGPGDSQQTMRVIAGGDVEQVRAAGRRVGARERRALSHGVVLELSKNQLRDLVRRGEIRNFSGDLPVRNEMLVTNPTVAADQVWAGWGGGLLGLGSYSGVTGQGVGVAVIDSGISTSHNALKSQVVASVDKASNAVGTNDEFGHGTHVAGIIAGKAPAGSTAVYSSGVAPGARLINVRVLGPDGSGLTSDVISGIDWVIENKDQYNIRVINLSVGHPVMESSVTDPLCQAVARAVSAGIVVVASAGNAGKTADGHMILGGISSPGNSPYAITVGATNTHSTTARSDDTVASYSSRGPTRFDFAVKPDVVAPGNRIVAPEAQNSWIASTYPAFHIAGNGANAYMALSGTSMSAPVVSGGVALLLQAKPGLTPSQVKLALQTTASFMPDAGLVGGGAGSINLRAARKTANDGLLLGLVTKIAGLLVPSSGAAYWDDGTLIRRVYDGPGLRLLSVLEAALAWLNPSLLHWGDLNLLGLQNPIANTAPNYIVWGDTAGWSTNYYIVWGDNINDPQGEYIVWGDNSWESDYIVWGDSTVFPDEP